MQQLSYPNLIAHGEDAKDVRDFVQRLIDAMPLAAEVREALRTELEVVNSTLQARTMYGVMVRDAAMASDPIVLLEHEALLDEVLASPFGMIPLARATALVILVGTLVYPGVPIEDAANRAMSDAIRTNFDAPIVQTLIASADSNWEYFLRDYRDWEKVVWSLESEMERPTGGTMRLSVPVPIARFLLPGFWRGMMPLFGVMGQTRTEHDGTRCLVEVTWTEA